MEVQITASPIKQISLRKNQVQIELGFYFNENYILRDYKVVALIVSLIGQIKS